MNQKTLRNAAAFFALLLTGVSVGEIISFKVSAYDGPMFTCQEWTGKAYTNKNGQNVSAEDVFAVNREPASVNAVPCQSTDAVVSAVWEYNNRENSDYLQMLIGSGQDWERNVVQNAAKAQGYLDGGFMNADYYAAPWDGWKTVQLPKSWTMQGFDFPIYLRCGNQSDPRVCRRENARRNQYQYHRRRGTFCLQSDGRCMSTGRSSQADFYEVRLYSKALTAQELASQNTASPAYAADSPYMQLWLDFDNLAGASLRGDVNQDGAVDLLDVTLLRDYLLTKKTFTAEQFFAGDLNGDGKVNAVDLSLLKQILM